MKLPRLFFATAPVFMALCAPAQAAEPAYNLVAIVTDDQAAWTLGCYGGKDKKGP